MAATRPCCGSEPLLGSKGLKGEMETLTACCSCRADHAPVLINSLQIQILLDVAYWIRYMKHLSVGEDER